MKRINRTMQIISLLTLGLCWCVSVARATIVASDDFVSNPFTSRWTQTYPGGSYDLQWTGASDPHSWSANLPTNANAHSVYSFSDGTRTMSTTDTSVPAGASGWNTMTYSVDFMIGGAGGMDNNYIGMLVNRSGDNGYTAGIYTGGDGNILWTGGFIADTWSGFLIQSNTWYRFVTVVTKSGADISITAQITDPSGNVLVTSPPGTFASAAYTDPHGFKITLANNGGYWNHASQIDNFKVDARKIVASDDFASNPFTSRWTQTVPGGSYDLQWTGASDPNSWSANLPTNANAHSVYSFSTGTRTMSTTDTSIPAGSAGWNTMTYSVDFQMGGTGGTDNNSIEVLVNRSGDNGYKAAIYTGGSGHIAWYGDYGLAWTGPDLNVAADTWYRFKTTVTKSGADISMYSQILDLSDNVLATSPTTNFTSAAYTDPNGFKISLGNYGGYWNHASQIDNFVVTATTPAPVTPDLITSDDFTANPFVATRWNKNEPAGVYPFLWTGDSNPSGFGGPAASLPANANAHSVYSFSVPGTRTMSTVNTNVPGAFSGWTNLSYSVDFILGGVDALGAPDQNAIAMLVNRNGDNGYESKMYTGGDGRVGWYGAYPPGGDYDGWYNGTPLTTNVWYRFVTDVTKSGADISMSGRVVRISDNATMSLSPKFTATGAAYTDPQGFKMLLSNGGGYWDHASQIDNFAVTRNPTQLFANGDMGLFTGTIPNGWVVSGGTLTSGSNSVNSPFLNAFANNSSSWIIDDSTDASGAAGFLQAWSTTTNYQSLRVNFDFMLPTLTGNPWGVQFDGAGAELVTGSSSVHYRIDLPGNYFGINAGPAGGVVTNILLLSPNTWYNVQAEFTVTAINDGTPNGAGFQSGSITPYGGTPTTWSNVPLLNTSLGFSRLLVRDRTASFGGDLQLDNVSVVVPVPPSTVPILNYTNVGGGQLQFSWTGSGILQWQTNSLSTGLGTNWMDYPNGGSSPLNVPIDPGQGSAFFRLHAQ